MSLKGGRKEQNQAQYLADAAGYDYRIGETRKLRGAVYGNVILSRFPGAKSGFTILRLLAEKRAVVSVATLRFRREKSFISSISSGHGIHGAPQAGASADEP